MGDTKVKLENEEGRNVLDEKGEQNDFESTPEYSSVKSINLVHAPTSGTSVQALHTGQEAVGRPRSAQSDHEIDASKDCENLFRNLNNAKRFAIDIGGSLTKIAYYSTVSHRRIKSASRGSPGGGGGGAAAVSNNDFEYEVWEGARLHFIKFETCFIEECLDFIQQNLAPNVGANCKGGKSIKATGGGSHKYSSLIQEKLGLTVEKEDEISCLIKGANFLLKNVPDEAFVFDRKESPPCKFLSAGPVVFPYLLVNIGSGVSILKVVSEENYERIGGTATGGGTFWGLGSLLTGGTVKEFDELLSMADKGDHRNVDMLVRDIYAGDYAKLGLPGDLIASSFGKAAAHSPSDFNKNDVIRSLLFTIANDIGQIACLYALQHELKRVYFGGYFLRNHPLSMHAVSYAIKFWSRGSVEALFLRHEGYLGAIGAFLKGTEELDTDKYSWQENFAGSSSGQLPVPNENYNTDTEESIPEEEDWTAENGMGEVENGIRRGSVTKGLRRLLRKKSSDFRQINFEQLEIDRMERPFGFFPLLDFNQKYKPDTMDLTTDAEAREYWLNCFEGWVERITTLAMESQPDSPTSTDRALRCRRKLMARLMYLKAHPCAYGLLTVRILLDTFEQSLREYDFPDPYWRQKRTENAAALIELPKRLAYLDKLDWKSRQSELMWGVLAGNVFDWGAKEVTNLLEGPDQFGFNEAMAKLQQRPWLVDKLDDWIQRLKDPGKVHRCAAIFVDNSGFDFIVGILPLVREFLQRGTKVILCTNSNPAVNDMTYGEMVSLLKEASKEHEWIDKGLQENYLKVAATGQGSPCLDLSRVNEDLNNLVNQMQTDLVIIEGMGRAIHTNLYAKIKSECIKLAVIKNKWLAKRLGGEVFSVVFSYER